MNIPRRQIHFIAACIILIIILAFIPQQTVTENEVFILLLIGFPLGIYLAASKTSGTS